MREQRTFSEWVRSRGEDILATATVDGVEAIASREWCEIRLEDRTEEEVWWHVRTSDNKVDYRSSVYQDMLDRMRVWIERGVRDVARRFE